MLEGLVIPPGPSSSDDAGISDVTPKGLLCNVLRLAGPFALQYLLMNTVSVVGAAFVGQLGTAQLNGFGVAAFLVNCFGLATITGLVMGLDSLLPQAFGMNRRHPMIAIYVQRCMVIMLLWCALVGVFFFTLPWWLIGLMLPHDSEAAAYASDVVRIMVAALPFYALFEVLQCYLAAMGRTFEACMGTIVGCMVNVALLYAFVTGDRRSFLGAPVSWVISTVIMGLVPIGVGTFWTNAFHSTWHGICWRKLWSGWGGFLRLAFPAMAMMLCEWSAFEVNGMVAARLLSRDDFAAMVIAQNVSYFIFPPALGILLASGIVAGNAIGANEIRAAKIATVIGYALLLIEFAIDATLLLSLRHVIPTVFSTNPKVRGVAADVIPFVLLSHVCDASFVYFGTIIRAHGHQRIGMIFSIGGYFVIGLPTGWALATKLAPQLGVCAFWLGPAIGQFIAAVSSVVYLVVIEWKQTSDIADALDFTESDDSGSDSGRCQAISGGEALPLIDDQQRHPGYSGD